MRRTARTGTRKLSIRKKRKGGKGALGQRKNLEWLFLAAIIQIELSSEQKTGLRKNPIQHKSLFVMKANAFLVKMWHMSFYSWSPFRWMASPLWCANEDFETRTWAMGAKRERCYLASMFPPLRPYSKTCPLAASLAITITAAVARYSNKPLKAPIVPFVLRRTCVYCSHGFGILQWKQSLSSWCRPNQRPRSCASN